MAGEGRLRRRRSRTLSGSALAVLVAIRRWRERSRVGRLLAAMSERELQDIGICRCDIAHRIAQATMV
jgi:uncharacterized protein YjiS (DUF1127 family)